MTINEERRILGNQENERRTLEIPHRCWCEMRTTMKPQMGKAHDDDDAVKRDKLGAECSTHGSYEICLQRKERQHIIKT
jgi:hypothetical protein